MKPMYHNWHKEYEEPTNITKEDYPDTVKFLYDQYVEANKHQKHNIFIKYRTYGIMDHREVTERFGKFKNFAYELVLTNHPIMKKREKIYVQHLKNRLGDEWFEKSRWEVEMWMKHWDVLEKGGEGAAEKA